MLLSEGCLWHVDLAFYQCDTGLCDAFVGQHSFYTNRTVVALVYMVKYSVFQGQGWAFSPEFSAFQTDASP